MDGRVPLLSELRFRSIGPAVTGGRIDDVENSIRRDDARIGGAYHETPAKESGM